MASTDVLIRLVADVTDLNKEMSSIKKQLENVENTTSKAGSTLTSTFKKVGTVIAGAFAVDKIKDFIPCLSKLLKENKHRHLN